MTGETSDTIILAEALKQRKPAGKNQRIEYQVERFLGRQARLHTRNCGTAAPYADSLGFEKRHATGENLFETLQQEDIGSACDWCYGDQWNYIGLLVESLRNRARHKNGRFCWYDWALELCHEAWKPGEEEAWCQWVLGKTVEQLRLEARKDLYWDEDVDESYVMCFDAWAGSSGSWMVGVGQHVSRSLAGSSTGVVVHGLVPARLVRYAGRRTAEKMVPVKPGFTQAMLEIAVNLYETGDTDGRTPDEVARNAVELAGLCLI